MKAIKMYIPNWLTPLLGKRELDIIESKGVRCLNEYKDGERVLTHQQIIEAENGDYFVIDSQKRMIIS